MSRLAYRLILQSCCIECILRQLTPVLQELSGIGLMVQLVNLLSQICFEADMSVCECQIPSLSRSKVQSSTLCTAKTGACCCPVFIAFIQAACRFSGRAATQQHERDDDASVACLLEAVNHVP